MEITDFLKSLNIDAAGSEQDGQYVIEIANAGDYAKIYSSLDSSDALELDENSIEMDEDNSVMFYDGDEYTCKLVGDLKNNKYQLIVTPIEK